WAVRELQADMCAFLIDAGADKYYRSDFGSCASDLAWDHIFKNPPSGHNPASKAVSKLRNLFDDGSAFDHVNYTPLHRIILGLSTTKLTEQLDLDGSYVNVSDSLGRTPLHWAAARGDIEKLKTLLQWGAKTNVSDNEATTPLHWAASNGTVECVLALLESGAEVNARSVYGSTPLHHVFLQQKAQVEMIDVLIRYGADKNARTKIGTCPLAFDIPTRTKERLQNSIALIERGADINAQDFDGDSAVSLAVITSDLGLLRILIDHGAFLDNCGSHGRTIIHEAAGNASIKTIELLTKANIKGINPSAKDVLGYTAWHIFEHRRWEWFVGERSSVEEERAALSKLIASLDANHVASRKSETQFEAK
ncbi:MAG: hypothetical protein Q9214_004199, partial [Letrouitia sp. 1 TL-2023]